MSAYRDDEAWQDEQVRLAEARRDDFEPDVGGVMADRNADRYERAFYGTGSVA